MTTVLIEKSLVCKYHGNKKELDSLICLCLCYMYEADYYNLNTKLNRVAPLIATI